MIRIPVRYKRFLRRQSNQVRKWNLEVLLTFLALLFSIYQNYDSNQKYLKNEADNDKELNRIRTRDNIQTKAQINQTKTLIEELREQKEENRRIRYRDSSQLALYNDQIKLLNKSVLAQTRELDIQNQSLSVQRIINKSDLSVNIKVKIESIEMDTSILHPLFTIKNRGKSPASRISIKYGITTPHSKIDQGSLSKPYFISNIYSQAMYGLNLYPDSTLIVGNHLFTGISTSVGASGITYKKIYNNNLWKIELHEIGESFLMWHLTFQDVYGKYEFENIAQLKYLGNPNFGYNYVLFPLSKRQVINLKSEIERNGFSFQKILKNAESLIGSGIIYN